MAGKVLLSEGTLTLASAVVIREGAPIHLAGMGKAATILTPADGADCNCIEGELGLVVEGVVLSNFSLDGNKATQTLPKVGLSHSRMDGLQCWGVEAHDWKGSGFAGIPFTDSVFIDCISRDNDIHGFICTNSGNRSRWLGCKAWNNGAQGFGIDNSTDNAFIGCLSRDNGDNGFDIFVMTLTLVQGCHIYDNGGWGIEEFMGAGENLFEGNVFHGNVSGAINRANASTIVRNNIGHITENSGTATLLNGQVAIIVAHGLDVTPAAGDILVTPMESLGAASEFYIDTYTAANFTIHVDVNPTQDVDFAWKAVVL